MTDTIGKRLAKLQAKLAREKARAERRAYKDILAQDRHGRYLDRLKRKEQADAKRQELWTKRKTEQDAKRAEFRAKFGTEPWW